MCFRSILHGTTKQLRLNRKGGGDDTLAKGGERGRHRGGVVTDVGSDGDRDSGGWRRVFVYLRGFHRGGEEIS